MDNRIQGIVDRLEGEWVVVEINGETKDYSKKLFPSTIQAGDVVLLEGGCFKIDTSSTQKRKEDIQALMDELWED